MNEEEFFDALEYAYKNEVVSLVWEGRGRGTWCSASLRYTLCLPVLWQLLRSAKDTSPLSCCN